MPNNFGAYPPQMIPPMFPPPPQMTPQQPAANAKVTNAPWHKPPGPVGAQSATAGIRPSYSTAAAKVNINVTKAPVNNVQKKTAPITVTPAATNSTPSKVPSVAPKTEWSSNVKVYVERAFLSCKTPAQRDAMEQLLRAKIKESIASEKMSKINWETEPIPLIPGVEIEKKQNITENFKVSTSTKVVMTAEEKKKLDRAKRFESDQHAFKKQQEQNQRALQNVRIEDNQGDVIDWDEYTIVGTCQKLEKPYLRLTSAPDPATVRPLPVLKAALKMLKDKWRNGTDYGYICDQFKSLRQDMTVQRIKSEFTVQVYEIHARIAIEQGDLGQYNQCQTQLKDLYSIGLPGSEYEFLAYRLLYLIHCRNKQAINQFMGELSEEQRHHEAVAHAFKVRSAVAIGNYSQLFQLYNDAPNMGAYLMDLFIPRERSLALNTMLKAYRPTVSIPFISKTLAFPSEDQCKSWLKNELGHYYASENLLDCKLILSRQSL